MDGAINVSMEPFRAFVGDLLPEEQRTAGYAAQSWFIGIGAVVASALPWIMSHLFNVGAGSSVGATDSVRFSYYIGGAALLACVLWTVISTREYSPGEMRGFQAANINASRPASGGPSARVFLAGGSACLVVGAAAAVALHLLLPDLGPQLLCGLIVAFGVAQILAGWLKRRGPASNGFSEVMDDLFQAPAVMRQLAVVQFFTWFGLFAMWIYATPAVTAFHYGAAAGSKAYNEGADWVGLLMAAYNGVAAAAAFALPVLARRAGRRGAHIICLILGGLGLMSFPLIHNPAWLLVSMAGVGIAWASILSTPYSILSSAVAPEKMGVYMGIFNFTIVTPQLLAATVLGLAVKTAFGGHAIWALVLGGACFIAAALATLAVSDPAGAARRPRPPPVRAAPSTRRND
jgi:maltose/moltooligosaccharide transporter